MQSSTLHQDLKVALLLSAWDLTITLLSSNPVFIDKCEGGLKKLWSTLLGFIQLLDDRVG